MSDRNAQEVIECKTYITRVHIVRSAIILYYIYLRSLYLCKNYLETQFQNLIKTHSIFIQK